MTAQLTDETRERPHLELRNLCKEYPGGVTAVDDISLSLPRGELLVLVGPSGCGKSTTLRCIAGIEEPTDGDILIGDDSVVERRPEDRDIAMVFQNYALYPHKTARQNIGFGLRMTTDLADEDVENRVERVAETLGITDLLEKKPASLSGGQQQRVALGRAIVRDPAVFLLDEPLSNLDATLRGQMRTEIQRLQRDLDVTTVYVTHDQTEAMTIGDRIAVLKDGRLQQLGRPMVCYHEPANRFVASFIGEPSMNLLDCRVDADGTFEGAVSYPADDALAAAASEAGSDEVTIGVRPEAPTLVEPDRDGEEPSFPGQVEVVEPVGERSFVYVTLDAGPQLTVAVSGETPLRERSAVRVRIPRDGVHVFDATTGQALHHPDWGDDSDSDSVFPTHGVEERG
jgi:multiple sugar transport system ATP-binding protein